MNLKEAYDRYSRWNLWPQLQGECGIYSFFYATLLLRTINPGGGLPEVHPRKYRGNPGQYPGGTPTTSVRSWSKTQLHSGQGELLTESEMLSMVTHFGYPAHIPG